MHITPSLVLHGITLRTKPHLCSLYMWLDDHWDWSCGTGSRRIHAQLHVCASGPTSKRISFPPHPTFIDLSLCLEHTRS